MTEFNIVPLTSKYEHQALDLVCQYFLAGSVIHQVLDISVQEYREHLRPSFSKMIAEELSLLAVEPKTGAALGIIMACDFNPVRQNLALIEAAPNDKFAPIKKLLAQLENNYMEVKAKDIKQTLLVDLALVSVAAQGFGLYKKLRQSVQVLGHKRGYKTVVGELSSAATQHVCINKMGHTTVVEIPYESFCFKNSQPFSSISSPASIKLVEGALS